jgi:hypothetical protein
LGIRTPEDLLIFVAEQLDTAGDPFGVGRDVSIDPLFEVPASEELVRLSALWARATAFGWFKGGTIEKLVTLARERRLYLTDLGAAAARRLYLTQRARLVKSRMLCKS